MENNFKSLLKETTSAVNRVHSIPSQDNKAEALKMLTKLSQQVENIQVESPKEIKKKQLAKLTKAELLAMLVDDDPEACVAFWTAPKANKTSKKKSRKRKPKHDNGSLARKARATRSANQRLDDYATKTSLAKLEMKFDDALNRRLTGVITR
tara:strand:- start:123 stop:578 length:456 start_codon:yes stop_codon:yes gene_type:complete